MRIRYLHLINLVLFVLASAFWVLHIEYDNGNFLYYFFLAKVYYSIFNKIIFPVGYWVCFCFFYGLYYLLCKKYEEHRELLIFNCRYALFFHFYLILLTHSNEFVSGFSNSILVYTIYEKIFISLALICYYLAGTNIVYKAMTSGCRLWELVLPISAIIPFIYFSSPLIYIFHITVSVGLYGVWRVLNIDRIAFFLGKLNSSSAAKIGAIFLLGLFFRVWYAFPYATFDLVGYSADGPVYFKSALAFVNGHWGDVNFWHAPFYSLYISGFLFLFGESSAVVFYSQAFIGAFTPVLIFLIGRKLKLRQAAFIAGLLVAVSHLCIHYSVVINRATPLTVTIPLLVYFLLCLRETFTPIRYFSLGVLFGVTFYFGQESLPFLIFLVIFIARYLVKSCFSSMQKICSVLLSGLGLIVVFFSLNGIYHSYSDQWLPLGRASDPNHSSSLWNYNNNSFAEKMVNMGFDPVSFQVESLNIFLDNPVQITRLLFGKLFSEIPDFLLDPGGTFFMPLHLSFETFYSANLQFYIYLFVMIGLAVFVFNKSITRGNKFLILTPIFSQIIFCSILLGTFRFRVPITPLNMILLASALEWFLFKDALRKEISWQRIQFKIPLFFKSTIEHRVKYLVFSTLIGVISFGIILNYFIPPTRGTLSQFQMTRWLILRGQNVKATKKTGLNQTVFSYYRKKPGPVPASEMEIQFKACRKLMPGIKPYYQLAVDGKLIGQPTPMLSGCSEIKERVNLQFDTGMISLFLFVSRDGNLGKLKAVSFPIIEKNGKQGNVIMPVPNALSLDEELKEYIKKFQLYSTSVKINKPDLYLLLD